MPLSPKRQDPVFKWGQMSLKWSSLSLGLLGIGLTFPFWGCGDGLGVFERIWWEEQGFAWFGDLVYVSVGGGVFEVWVLSCLEAKGELLGRGLIGICTGDAVTWE